MVKTVDEGFRAFHGTLTPTRGESQAAKSHRISIETCLKKHFGTIPFFPSGSFENGTSIRSYSDADYFACIPAKNLEEHSFTTLQDIQNILTEVLPYAKIDIRPPAVRVRFRADVPGPTEITPAKFLERDKDGNYIYEIANGNGDGGWQRSSPDAHKNYVDEVDGRQFRGNGEVKRLVRFLKAWKYYCDVPMKSFYLELFVTRYAFQKSSILYSKDVRNILACLWNEQLAALKDPKDISGSIQPCLEEQKTDALSKLETAFIRAGKAREAEKAGNISDAFYWWNLVFARKFPPYY